MPEQAARSGKSDASSFYNTWDTFKVLQLFYNLCEYNDWATSGNFINTL